MPGLRIIGGTAHGRRLRSVPGNSTRPITDRTKKSLFNILGADIQGAKFLDLFAGTGSVGIEALSRGADFVRFIDLNRRAVETIRINLETTGFIQSAEVIRTNSFGFLAQKPDTAFDYIYIAPPEYKGMWNRALETLCQNMDWLAEDAWVIVRIHPIEYTRFAAASVAEEQQLVEFDQRHYGSTLLIFYRKTIDR